MNCVSWVLQLKYPPLEDTLERVEVAIVVVAVLTVLSRSVTTWYGIFFSRSMKRFFLIVIDTAELIRGFGEN